MQYIPQTNMGTDRLAQGLADLLQGILQRQMPENVSAQALLMQKLDDPSNIFNKVLGQYPKGTSAEKAPTQYADLYQPNVYQLLPGGTGTNLPGRKQVVPGMTPEKTWLAPKELYTAWKTASDAKDWAKVKEIEAQIQQYYSSGAEGAPQTPEVDFRGPLGFSPFADHVNANPPLPPGTGLGQGGNIDEQRQALALLNMLATLGPGLRQREPQGTHGMDFFANGGPVRGLTDTIPAMLSPGEFVMNPNATAVFKHFLQAMNQAVPASGPKVFSPVSGFEGGTQEPVKKPTVPYVDPKLQKARQERIARLTVKKASPGLTDGEEDELAALVAAEQEAARTMAQEGYAPKAEGQSGIVGTRQEGEVLRQKEARSAQAVDQYGNAIGVAEVAPAEPPKKQGNDPTRFVENVLAPALAGGTSMGGGPLFPPEAVASRGTAPAPAVPASATPAPATTPPAQVSEKTISPLYGPPPTKYAVGNSPNIDWGVLLQMTPEKAMSYLSEYAGEMGNIPANNFGSQVPENIRNYTMLLKAYQDSTTGKGTALQAKEQEQKNKVNDALFAADLRKKGLDADLLEADKKLKDTDEWRTLQKADLQSLIDYRRAQTTGATMTPDDAMKGYNTLLDNLLAGLNATKDLIKNPETSDASKKELTKKWIMDQLIYDSAKGTLPSLEAIHSYFDQPGGFLGIGAKPITDAEAQQILANVQGNYMFSLARMYRMKLLGGESSPMNDAVKAEALKLFSTEDLQTQ